MSFLLCPLRIQVLSEPSRENFLLPLYHALSSLVPLKKILSDVYSKLELIITEYSKGQEEIFHLDFNVFIFVIVNTSVNLGVLVLLS